MKNWYFIYGPMFAGKTTTALAFIKNCSKSLTVVIHVFDKKRSNLFLETHSHLSVNLFFKNEQEFTPSPFVRKNIKCVSLDTEELCDYVFETDYIFIDEAQFFDPKILDHLDANKHIYFFGLDKDFRGSYFPLSERLLNVIPVQNQLFLKAVCECGNLATFSKLKNPENSSSNIIIGGSDKYKSVCSQCFHSCNSQENK